MEFEVQTTIAPIVGMTSILSDVISKKYDSINDLNSIKVNAEEENYEDINPVIDSMIEDENNHIGKLQQLIDLLNGSEDDIAEGKAETIELIDNPEIMESIKMGKKLILNENFDNVIDDVQAVADPVFVGANEEHDENKKKYEDAIKENEKEAKETIPKEGETGKKVTSKGLKSMKLSEELFEDLDWDTEDDLRSAVYNALAQIMFEFTAKRDAMVNQSDMDKAYEWFVTHFFLEDGSFNESLNESFVQEWWGQTDEDPREFARKFGLKATAVKRNGDETLYVFRGSKKDIERARKAGYFYSLDHGEDAGHSSDLSESLQVSIAKEQIQRFTEGKMPKNWSVDNYLTKLTEKKHITQKEAKSLKEWYNGKQKR